MRLTRCYRFSASHRLHSPRLSEEKNRALYGKCANPYGHGHNYVLEVSVGGPLDAATGQVVNVGALDGLVREQILERYDHRNLNADIEELAGVVPTTENLAQALWRALKEAWPGRFAGGGAALESIRIQETERNIFELNRES